jgi:hypothetical protein
MAARRRHRRDVAGSSRVTANLLRLPTMLMLGVILLALAGILTFAGSRNVTSSSPPNTARSSPPPTRPALTPAEERYIRELWPIHGDVERSTMRMSLGQIFYKTQDLGQADLRKRVEQALAVYQKAEARLGGLEPPPSLQREHDEYASAVRLFRESAIEVLKMFEDGRDDHMLAAYPKGQAGANKIREVGGKFWPHEFPAN